MDPPWANATVTQLGGFREGEEIWSFKVNGGVHRLCNPQVNILQKLLTGTASIFANKILRKILTKTSILMQNCIEDDMVRRNLQNI